MHRPLNHRQERFVYEFLKDQNASAAAVRAGYSARTKGTHAAALMRHPLVAERIRLGLADLYASLNITALSLLRQQARVAFFDPGKLFDAAGDPVPLDQLDPEILSVLTVHYDTRKNGDWVKRVRQPARQQALAALERRYAQFLALQTEAPGRDHAGEEMRDAPQAHPPARPQPPEPALWPLFADRAPPTCRPSAASTQRRAQASAAPSAPQPEQERQEPPLSEPPWVESERVEMSSLEPRPAAVRQSECGLDVGNERPAAASRPASSSHPSEAPPVAAADAAAPGTAVERVAAPAPAPAPEPAYDFRKDPNWMWGGTPRPKPAPAPREEAPLPLESLPANFRLRPGAVVPARNPTGFVPPWLRRERPAYAETGSVFGDDD